MSKYYKPKIKEFKEEMEEINKILSKNETEDEKKVRIIINRIFRYFKKYGVDYKEIIKNKWIKRRYERLNLEITNNKEDKKVEKI